MSKNNKPDAVPAKLREIEGCLFHGVHAALLRENTSMNANEITMRVISSCCAILCFDGPPMPMA